MFALFVLPVFNYFRDRKGLRKYPGFSPWSGFTDMRHIWLTSGGYRSRDLYEAHKKSPILRTGPNALSFGDIRAVKDIYGHGTKVIKDLSYVLVSGSHRQLFDVVDKGDHSRKRKALSAAFAIKHLERWEHKVVTSTQRLLNAMDAHCTEPMKPDHTIPDPMDVTMDWGWWVNLFTIEAINNIALSSRMDLLDTGTDNVTAQKMDGTNYSARYRHSRDQTVRAQCVWVWDYAHYPWLVKLAKLHPKYRKAFKDGEPWGDIVWHQAKTRLNRSLAGEQLDDFFSSLWTDKQGHPNNLEWGEIIAEVGAIINAGSDTTAIALTQVLEFLLVNPPCLVKLREELDPVLDEEDIVAPYDKVKDLPYLRACIDESLRIQPPTSAGLPRRTPPEGAQIMGEWIPGDTSISMTIYATHRDPHIFPDPESFKPERWLDEEYRKRMEPYFIPFSAGARGCLGRNISYLEQVVVLASIVHRYDFVLPYKEWKLERFEAFNLLVGEMPLKIWRRERGVAGVEGNEVVAV
ncbi:cytochrome P450 [Aspergillus stella-maris]|uniref:cytochrome P450 n=1 Tax=Aspergillus stella-maris TaxID=1810926 RepID=UPI003CCCF099